MLSTPGQVRADPDPADSSSVLKKEMLRRRVHHKKPGRRGKVLVGSMVFLVVAYLAMSGGLAIAGRVHPIVEEVDRLALGLLYGLFLPVVFICLFRLYRGSVSVRHIISGTSVAAALTFAILVTVGWLNEWPRFWILLDALGFLTATFVAWTCLFSRNVSRFLTLQSDKPH